MYFRQQDEKLCLVGYNDVCGSLVYRIRTSKCLFLCFWNFIAGDEQKNIVGLLRQWNQKLLI